MAKPPIIVGGVSQVEGAIRQPSNPHHFMVLKPVNRRVRILFGERLLADTTGALCLIEIGRKAHDPVLYVPAIDLVLPLDEIEKTTHCPLKGDASYYAVDGEELSWAYKEQFDFAKELTGLHAFWASKVRVEQDPEGIETASASKLADGIF